MPKFIEQADKTADGFQYTWILDGPRKRDASKLPGWNWMTGLATRGIYWTKDIDVAIDWAMKNGGKAAESNGTHLLHGAPLCIGTPTQALVNDKGALKC